MDYELIESVARTATTLAIAIVASWIAWRQWQTNRDKVKLDLFDRRWECYREFETFIRHVLQNMDLELEALSAFDRGTARVHFLFGTDVECYRKDLRGHAVALRNWNGIYKHGTQHPDGVGFQKAVRTVIDIKLSTSSG